MTVEEDISEQGNAKGKRENSSTTVRRYLLREMEGRGPLKSTLIRSKGCVALMRFTVCGE
jgi:hypothetical protein